MKGERSWWLPIAQGLYNGEVKRVCHPQDRRASTVIRNEPDRWSAYCFRRGYDSVLKEHTLPRTAPPTSHNLDIPTDDVPLTTLPKHEAEWAMEYLLKAGVASFMLPRVTYSKERARLLIHDPCGLVVGRDLTGRSAAKWITYKNPLGYLGRVGVNPVLVEDPLSYYKLKYALGGHYSPVALLGTAVVPRLQRQLNGRPDVHLMMDGDAAGRRAVGRIVRSLVGVGKFHVHEVPWGCDPKDLTVKQLRGFFT